ncbi:hypothetical protein [Vibrio cholerae]|uniref:hypothetical protein n=1 Tax=Vibrio cholerae TaxID=666 RepID=UPI0015CF1359
MELQFIFGETNYNTLPCCSKSHHERSTRPKHRSNILSDFTYDPNQHGEGIYQISFKPFGIHGEVSVNDYLNREYNRENALIIELGNKLNQSVSCMLTNG